MKDWIRSLRQHFTITKPSTESRKPSNDDPDSTLTSAESEVSVSPSTAADASSPHSQQARHPPALPSFGTMARVDQQFQDAMDRGVFDNLPKKGQPVEPPPLALLLDPAALIEQHIQQAIQSGVFNELDGAGKPLNLQEDRMIPEETRRMLRFMKAYQLKPLWIELGREVEVALKDYYAWRQTCAKRWATFTSDQRGEVKSDLEQRLLIINNMIHNINATAPTDQFRMGLLVYKYEYDFIANGPKR